VKTSAVILVLVAIASSMAMVGVAADGFTTAQTADSGTVAPGDNVTLNVTLENIPSDATSAAIDVQTPDGWSVVSPTEGGLGNCTEACSPDATYKPNETQFLLFVNGSNPSSFTVNYTVAVPESASDGSYSFDANGSFNNGTLTWDNTTTMVSVSTGPPSLPGLSDAPKDPDNDGKYEDVNGDGSVNVGDVQALFAGSESSAVQNHIDAFDFNNDGSVNVGDVQALFAKGEDVPI
jgi:hypothetical protein